MDEFARVWRRRKIIQAPDRQKLPMPIETYAVLRCTCWRVSVEAREP